MSSWYNFQQLQTSRIKVSVLPNIAKADTGTEIHIFMKIETKARGKSLSPMHVKIGKNVFIN